MLTDRNVIFIWQNALNWYDLKLFGNSIQLQKVVGGQQFFLSNDIGSFPFQVGTVYHFKIFVTYGKKITVFVENQKVLEVIDQPPLITGFRTLGLQATVGAAGRSLSYLADIFVYALDLIEGKILSVPVFKQNDST